MRNAGFSLVGTIVAVALVLLLAGVFVTGGGGLFGQKAAERPDGVGRTIVGRSMAAGKDTECRSSLSQVRMAIQVYGSTSDDAKPESLAALRLGESMLKCAVGGEPYDYDPSTGVVRCPHKGHERY